MVMVAEMEVIHGLDNMDFQSPRLTRYYWASDQPTAETNIESHYSLGWPISNLVAGWLHWTTSSYGFAFFTHFFFAQSTICGLTERFICCHSIPHSIVSDPEKCNSGHMIIEFWFYMFPTTLKQLAWNGLFKTQLQWQQPGELGKSSSKGGICFEYIWYLRVSNILVC